METTTKTTNVTKKCKRCGEELPLSSFSKRRDSRDGLQFLCKKCACAYVKERREAKKKHQFSFTQKDETHLETPKMSEGVTLENPTLANMEETLIKETFSNFPHDSISKCAMRLGISERTLYRKINTYNLRDLVASRTGYRKKDFDAAIENNGLTKIKTLEDYTARELLEELHKRGYDGHFWRYVKEEMSMSKLFGGDNK